MEKNIHIYITNKEQMVSFIIIKTQIAKFGSRSLYSFIKKRNKKSFHDKMFILRDKI